MSERCELTDLLVDQCAHCRPPAPNPIAPSGLPVYTTMRANFPGTCAWDDGHTIDAGDLIGRTEIGWVCTPCVDDLTSGAATGGA